MSLNEKYEDGGVTLPAPEGSPVSKVPKLLPEQFAADKNNINLNYVSKIEMDNRAGNSF